MRKIKLMITALILRVMDRILVDDLYMAYHGSDLYFTLWDLDQDYFRKNIKYNPRDLSDEQLIILEEARDELYKIMSEHGVDFDHVE